METIDYKRRSLFSVKWSYAGSILPKVVSPLVLVLLARILTPEDFGSMAVAYLVISFVEMSRQAGISRAVIQSDLDERTVFNISFFLNGITGTAAFGFVFAAAPFVAAFFNNPVATPVLRVLGIQILLSSFSLNYQSILTRRIDFKTLFYVNLIPSASLVLITVPLAYLGYGIWSIVMGNLGAAFFRAIGLFVSLPWLPKTDFSRNALKKFLRFGLYCYLEALLGWIYLWGDKAVLGRCVDTNALGQYALAKNATTGIINAFVFPLSQIVYPYMCKEKSSPAMDRMIYRLLSYLSIVSLPLCAVIFHTASTLPFFLGEKWDAVVFPVRLLSVSTALSMIFTYVIPDTVKATGRADALFRLQLLKLVYTIPVLILGAAYQGVIGFCIAKLVTVVIGCLLFCRLGAETLGLKYREIVCCLQSPFSAFSVTFLLLAGLKAGILFQCSPWVAAAAVPTVGISVFFVTLILIDRPLVVDFFAQCRRAMPASLLRAVSVKPNRPVADSEEPTSPQTRQPV